MDKKIIIFIVAGIVILVLAAIVIIGGEFSFQIGETRERAAEREAAQEPKLAPKTQEGWQEFKSEQFGYTVSYPASWIVKEQPIQDVSPELLIVEPNGLAFVRIVAFYDPSLTDADAIRASIAAYREKLRSGEEDSRLFDFESDVQENIGGFFAYGEFYLGDTLHRYEERGLLATNGRVLLMRGAVFVTEFDKLAPTLAQMMDSFVVNP